MFLPEVDSVNDFEIAEERWLRDQCADLANDDINEVDIKRYFRRMYGFTDHHCLISEGKDVTSKAVQTRVCSSDIPPAWILSGQSLVEDLYTGLGNALNALYHPPKREFDGQRQKSQGPSSTSFLSYEDGYWRSKLLPEIKIAGTENADRQLQILHSVSFKNSLKELMTVASKLKTLVSYLDESFDQTRASNDVLAFKDKCQQTDPVVTNFAVCECKTNEDPGICVGHLNGSKDLDPLGEAASNCPVKHEFALKDVNMRKETAPNNMQGEGSKYSSNQVNAPDSYVLPTAKNKSKKFYQTESVAAVDAPAPGKENSCHGCREHQKQGTSGGVCKNFIKRNILATKTLPTRNAVNVKHGEASSGSADVQRQKNKVARL